MTQDMTGKHVLTTNDRIAIGQCLNLAVESLKIAPFAGDYMLAVGKKTRQFYKLKKELEEEYVNTGTI